MELGSFHEPSDVADSGKPPLTAEIVFICNKMIEMSWRCGKRKGFIRLYLVQSQSTRRSQGRSRGRNEEAEAEAEAVEVCC